jgi:hypothetical protein
LVHWRGASRRRSAGRVALARHGLVGPAYDRVVTTPHYWRLVLGLAFAWAAGILAGYLLLGLYGDGAAPAWVGVLFYALYGLSLFVALLAVLGAAAGLLRFAGLVLGRILRSG